MTSLPIFVVHVLLSLVSSALLAILFAWPWLRAMPRNHALLWVVAPHTLLRFIGLSFLVPGVVSPDLPHTFAIPAAYGDLIAGLLAVTATIALSQNASWAIGAVWLFTLWGAADLLAVFYEGPLARITPGQLGAAYFIPTTMVPPLLVTHFLALRLLTKGRKA
jgi:hypothetical protein